MAETSLLKFVNREQAYPAKRMPEIRAEDFREIADRYAMPDAEIRPGAVRNVACPIVRCIARCTTISPTGCA